MLRDVHPEDHRDDGEQRDREDHALRLFQFVARRTDRREDRRHQQKPGQEIREREHEPIPGHEVRHVLLLRDDVGATAPDGHQQQADAHHADDLARHDLHGADRREQHLDDARAFLLNHARQQALRDPERPHEQQKHERERRQKARDLITGALVPRGRVHGGERDIPVQSRE